MTRKGLDPAALGEFVPRRKEPTEPAAERAPAHAPSAAWSRREAPQEGQFTIRARLDAIDRFKRLCRPPGGGRFTYGEMLEKLMDEYERGRDDPSGKPGS